MKTSMYNDGVKVRNGGGDEVSGRRIVMGEMEWTSSRGVWWERRKVFNLGKVRLVFPLIGPLKISKLSL